MFLWFSYFLHDYFYFSIMDNNWDIAPLHILLNSSRLYYFMLCYGSILLLFSTFKLLLIIDTLCQISFSFIHQCCHFKHKSKCWQWNLIAILCGSTGHEERIRSFIFFYFHQKNTKMHTHTCTKNSLDLKNFSTDLTLR